MKAVLPAVTNLKPQKLDRDLGTLYACDGNAGKSEAYNDIGFISLVAYFYDTKESADTEFEASTNPKFTTDIQPITGLGQRAASFADGPAVEVDVQDGTFRILGQMVLERGRRAGRCAGYSGETAGRPCRSSTRPVYCVGRGLQGAPRTARSCRALPCPPVKLRQNAGRRPAREVQDVRVVHGVLDHRPLAGCLAVGHKPLPVLFGGPHLSEPSFRRAGVKVGDLLYPVAVSNRRVHVVARMRVREMLLLGQEDGPTLIDQRFPQYKVVEDARADLHRGGRGRQSRARRCGSTSRSRPRC